MIAYEGHQCSELLRDKHRLDALLSMNVDVWPADDGETWLLVDFRVDPPRTTEHQTARAAIDAAMATERAPALWGGEPSA